MDADANSVVPSAIADSDRASPATGAGGELGQLRRQMRWFDQAPGFVAVLSGPDHVYEFVNDAYCELTGHRPLIGLTVRQALPELEGQGYFEILGGVMMTGERYVARQMPVVLSRDGVDYPRLLDFIYEPVFGEDGRPEAIFVQGQDLTEAHEAELGFNLIQRRQALLVELNDRMRDLEDPADLSYAAAELLGSALQVSRVGYGVIDVASETITIERDWNAPGIKTIAGTLHFRDYGTYIEDLKRGETVVCADAYADPRTMTRADALKAISAQAFVNMPVSEQGGVVALLYLNHAHARTWSPEELALVREVAERTRVAVERRRAETALKESARRLRLAVDAARLAVWEFDIRAGKLKPSPELNAMLGYEPQAEPDLEELLARYHAEDREIVRDAAQAALARGERFFEAQYRYERPDGALRWFLLRAELLLDPAGAPAAIVGVLLDITAQKAAEQSLRERDADLKAAMDAGSLAPFDIDHAAGTVAPSPRLNRMFGYPPDQTLTVDDVRARYHPADRDTLVNTSLQHQPEAGPFNWQLRLLMPDGEVRWLESRGEHQRGPSGKLARSRGVLLDITERKTAEERQRLLLNELNHRVKNTLAIVQGLAQQSFRRQREPEKARAAFEARLTALAAAHNLLTRNSWEPAFIAEVVEASLTAALGSDIERVDYAGPELKVPPQTAVSIALALHELSTNAIKYGALSEPGGVIRLRWETAGEEGQARFRLTWTERGGPAVRPPEARGFGSRMIEHGLAADLGGQASLTFEPEGVVYRIDAPLPVERKTADA